MVMDLRLVGEMGKLAPRKSMVKLGLTRLWRWMARVEIQEGGIWWRSQKRAFFLEGFIPSLVGSQAGGAAAMGAVVSLVPAV